MEEITSNGNVYVFNWLYRAIDTKNICEIHNCFIKYIK